MSDDPTPRGASEAGDDLLILFARGDRPTASQVREACVAAHFADSAGPDLSDRSERVDIAPPGGIALQRAGLTFDLVGLAPGPAVPVPEMGENDAIRATILPSRTDAVSLRLGPHIAAGRRSVAILREWFALAAGLAESFGGTGLCWVPGAVAISLANLKHNLAAWDARCEVPVNLLASFRRTLDGAVQSHGLGYFTGQELRIESPLVGGSEEALARLLFTHLFYAGAQQGSAQLAAPDGHPLRLEPSGNGRFVRVWPG